MKCADGAPHADAFCCSADSAASRQRSSDLPSFRSVVGASAKSPLARRWRQPVVVANRPGARVSRIHPQPPALRLTSSVAISGRMIVSYRDAKTERFANGGGSISQQAENRLDRLEAATSLQDLAALPGKRSRPSASLCSAPAHSTR